MGQSRYSSRGGYSPFGRTSPSSPFDNTRQVINKATQQGEGFEKFMQSLKNDYDRAAVSSFLKVVKNDVLVFIEKSYGLQAQIRTGRQIRSTFNNWNNLAAEVYKILTADDSRKKNNKKLIIATTGMMRTLQAILQMQDEDITYIFTVPSLRIALLDALARSAALVAELFEDWSEKQKDEILKRRKELQKILTVYDLFIVRFAKLSKVEENLIDQIEKERKSGTDNQQKIREALQALESNRRAGRVSQEEFQKHAARFQSIAEAVTEINEDIGNNVNVDDADQSKAVQNVERNAQKLKEKNPSPPSQGLSGRGDTTQFGTPQSSGRTPMSAGNGGGGDNGGQYSIDQKEIDRVSGHIQSKITVASAFGRDREGVLYRAAKGLSSFSDNDPYKKIGAVIKGIVNPKTLDEYHPDSEANFFFEDAFGEIKKYITDMYDSLEKSFGNDSEAVTELADLFLRMVGDEGSIINQVGDTEKEVIISEVDQAESKLSSSNETITDYGRSKMKQDFLQAMRPILARIQIIRDVASSLKDSLSDYAEKVKSEYEALLRVQSKFQNDNSMKIRLTEKKGGAFWSELEDAVKEEGASSTIITSAKPNDYNQKQSDIEKFAKSAFLAQRARRKSIQNAVRAMLNDPYI